MSADNRLKDYERLVRDMVDFFREMKKCPDCMPPEIAMMDAHSDRYKRLVRRAEKLDIQRIEVASKLPN